MFSNFLRTLASASRYRGGLESFEPEHQLYDLDTRTAAVLGVWTRPGNQVKTNVENARSVAILAHCECWMDNHRQLQTVEHLHEENRALRGATQ